MPPTADTAELAQLTLRHRLRQATSASHQRVDAAFGALNLTRLPDYRCFLEASAAALLPLEGALAEAGVVRVFPDWEQRSRRRAILDDLAHVGGEFVGLPSPKPLDPSGVLGVMYVLEGSRLGARYLLKTIEASPDPRVAGATAYLRHGQDEGLWPSFVTALDQHAASLADDQGAIRAALTAFDMFEQGAVRAVGSLRKDAGYR